MGRKSLKTPRQQEIIKAFYQLAKKEGLENASIAKTAALIDINPSLVMHYFKSRESLIDSLIEFILDKYLLIYRIQDDVNAGPKKNLLKVIDNIFSNKWNALFADSVSYSCYSMAFRNKSIKRKYKDLLDTLRDNLQQLIADCKNRGILSVQDPVQTADIIFVLVDGAYYYLCLVSDKKEYQQKLNQYKKQAISLLNFVSSSAR